MGLNKDFQGKVGRYFEDSEPWWPPIQTPREDAPNVVVVLLDDVGYAQFGCYGSDLDTPTFDALAAKGLRYSNYHTTALCSPTRACLLTGRNHHASGMACVVEFAQGFPGYDANIPPENGFLSEVLNMNGYATFALGKWHLAPAYENNDGGPRTHWPLSKGFDRFYGFLAGETDQFHPDLIHDNHQVEPPKTPEEGYHITEDMTDRAIQYIKDLRAFSPVKPFFMYYAPGACHAPHQAPKKYIDAYKGKFDKGWDAWREEVFARQVDSALLPDGTELSERPSWVPAWDTLNDDQRRLYTRLMEAFAGFMTHTDEQVGRLLQFIDSLGELDNTIVVVMSDNGASAEGGPTGSHNEKYFFNFVPESLEENLKHINDIGTQHSNNHYPWGWAWAGNTPLKRFKRDTHEGGVCDPMIVHWPAGLGTPGQTRRQYVHAIDLAPTLLELIGIEMPNEIKGVTQSPIEGTSFAYTFDDPAAPQRHLTQYYEMMGSRAIYHDGWKAVVYHPPMMANYEDKEISRRSFEEDVWELYHVAEDFSECHDVAAQFPDKLEEMKTLWWQEAEKNQVLPLNNTPGKFGDRRWQRQRYIYHHGIASIPETTAPNLRNRSFHINAELTIGAGADCDGIIVCHGGHAGGYALYIKGRRLHYVHNFLGSIATTVSASEELPAGDILVRAVFNATGRFRGEMNLYYGDVPMGSGNIPITTPISYGVDPFSVGYQRMGSISSELPGKFEIPEGVLHRVVIDAIGRAYRDPEGEQRAALARQ
jgi:arylsulfatase A-like enzyme